MMVKTFSSSICLMAEVQMIPEIKRLASHDIAWK
jgi:hypothetical protein